MLAAAAARPAQVWVRQVQQVLVVRVRVHRRHQPAHYFERVVDHLHHRHEAVGRARRIGHDDVVHWIEVLVVHADHERGIGITRRGRDNDPLYRLPEMRRRLVPAGEETGRFEHDLGTEFGPGQQRGLALGQDPNVAVADEEVAAFDVDGHGQAALGAVVAQQVRERVRRSQVVDPDHFDVRTGSQHGAQEVAPDAPEAVDPDPHRHVIPSFSVYRAPMPADLTAPLPVWRGCGQAGSRPSGERRGRAHPSHRSPCPGWCHRRRHPQ